MRIGLDFDGTIADWRGAMAHWLRTQLGRELDATRNVADQIAREQLQAMVAAILGTELTLAMEPMAGALDATSRLAAEHTLYVVTARNDVEASFAARWIDRHRVPVVEVVHTDRASKTTACQALGLDLLLDDTPAVLADLVGGATMPVLLESRFRRAGPLPAGLHLVEHWAAFEALCARVGAGAARGA